MARLHRRPHGAWLWGALCGLLFCNAPAKAHWMNAQNGTLNLVDDGAFLVLSVAVSAVRGADDNGDGLLSKAELHAHAEAVQTQVAAGVQLLGAEGGLPLQLIMVDVTPPDDAPDAGASQLLVLGRFQLPGTVKAADSPVAVRNSGLALRFTLFGAKAEEREQQIAVTAEQESQLLRFTPGQAVYALFVDAAVRGN